VANAVDKIKAAPNKLKLVIRLLRAAARVETTMTRASGAVFNIGWSPEILRVRN
jgi:hypothetical protein